MNKEKHLSVDQLIRKLQALPPAAKVDVLSKGFFYPVDDVVVDEDGFITITVQQ